MLAPHHDHCDRPLLCQGLPKMGQPGSGAQTMLCFTSTAYKRARAFFSISALRARRPRKQQVPNMLLSSYVTSSASVWRTKTSCKLCASAINDFICAANCVCAPRHIYAKNDATFFTSRGRLSTSPQACAREGRNSLRFSLA